MLMRIMVIMMAMNMIRKFDSNQNKYNDEETKDINMEDLYSNQGIDAEILNSQELDTVEEECITDDVIGIISSSKSSKMELSCSAIQAVKPGSKSKWSMSKSFQFYQQCTAQGKRLVRKCPTNAVFWNILQLTNYDIPYPTK